jgi:phosphoglycerate dehydrogenase-like enzyme
MKVVSTWPFPEEALERFRALSPGLEVVVARGEEFLAEAADAEVALGSYGGGQGGAFQRLLRGAPGLRWVHTSSAGVDPLLVPEFMESEVVLTCGKGEVVGSLLAEHAFALMLSLTRGIGLAVREGRWDRGAKASRSGYEVRGKTMGIVGFGGVGRELARRAAAFEMRVVAVKRSPAAAPAGVAALWTHDRLPDLLAEADVVVLAVPLTEETQGMIGEAELRRMKGSALLITVGRGETVQMEPLVRALSEGWIGGAGLDVLPEEPLPDDSPLWKLPNVVITSHCAGNSPQRAVRNMELMLANMERFLKGEPLLNVVDREARY